MPTLTPKQLAAHFRRAAAAVPSAIVAAEQQTVKDALANAAALSSGGSSLAQLRVAGHPYSRQRPNPAYDAAIINVQSGRFRADWRGQGPRTIGGVVTSHVVNASPEAKYMQGTRRMIARPIADAIRSSVAASRAARLARLRQALRRVLLP